MGVRSAEMTKYAANCLLATKISFINEVANICERVGADVREVRSGIGSDHRIGYQFIYPGLGYGGSCFPKDVKALIDTARHYEFEPQLLASVDDVNKRQKHILSQKIEAHFTGKGGLKGKTLALWGLAFKANTDDVREASSFELIADLTAQGMMAREAGGSVKRPIFIDRRSFVQPSLFCSVRRAAAAVAGCPPPCGCYPNVVPRRSTMAGPCCTSA